MQPCSFYLHHGKWLANAAAWPGTVGQEHPSQGVPVIAQLAHIGPVLRVCERAAALQPALWPEALRILKICRSVLHGVVVDLWTQHFITHPDAHFKVLSLLVLHQLRKNQVTCNQSARTSGGHVWSNHLDLTAGRDEVAAKHCGLFGAAPQTRRGHREHAHALLYHLSMPACTDCLLLVQVSSGCIAHPPRRTDLPGWILLEQH